MGGELPQSGPDTGWSRDRIHVTTPLDYCCASFPRGVTVGFRCRGKYEAGLLH